MDFKADVIIIFQTGLTRFKQSISRFDHMFNGQKNFPMNIYFYLFLSNAKGDLNKVSKEFDDLVKIDSLFIIHELL